MKDKNCRENNDKHYVGEHGTMIFIDCGIDVQAASLAEVFMEWPDGTTIKKTAVLTTFDESTDYVYIIIDIGDFNQNGRYTGQVFIVLGAWSGWGQPFKIDVDDPISSSSSSSSSA